MPQQIDVPGMGVVEFPDGMTDDQITAAIQANAPQGQSSTLADVAKSAGIGLAQGAIGLAGLPGDIGSLASAAAKSVGIPEIIQEGVHMGTQAVPGLRAFTGPSSQDLREKIEGVAGSFYKPKTTAGEYVRTLGEFAPFALAGPGGVVRKVATTAIPAVLSETAGQVTKGTPFEPYARAGGALVGGLSTSIGRRPISIVAREAAKDAPTAEALKAQTNALYGRLRQAGIQYDTNAFGNAVADMHDTLLKKGMRPSITRQAFDYLNDLAKEAGKKTLEFDDVNSFREVAGDMAREANRAGSNKLALAFDVIRDKLDDFEKASPLVGNSSMSQTEIAALRGEARKVALQRIKSRALEDVVKNAETYQGGEESGIRNQISNLLRSKRGMQLFKGAERDALLQVAKGRKPLQTLSRFGFDLTSLSGNATFLPTVGALGAGLTGGPLVGGALATAGTAAKLASPLLTKRAFNTAASAIRSGKLAQPAAAQRIQQLTLEDLARKLQAGGMTYLGATTP